jgi:hypothetical protein
LADANVLESHNVSNFRPEVAMLGSRRAYIRLEEERVEGVRNAGENIPDPEDGESMVLKNYDIYQPVYIIPKSR